MEGELVEISGVEEVVEKRSELVRNVSSGSKKLLLVSPKQQLFLNVHHGISHAAEDVQNAGFTNVDDIKKIHDLLSAEIRKLYENSCCGSEKRIDYDNVSKGIQEMCAEKEWIRNVIIDLLLTNKLFAGAGEEIKKLKALSQDTRTKSSALRLRFNRVKGCKNSMQQALKLLDDTLESEEKAPKKAFRLPCLPVKPPHKRRVSKSFEQTLGKIAELVFHSYFGLPFQARLGEAAKMICKVDLVWVERARLNRCWQKKSAKWTGRFAQEGQQKFPTLSELEQVKSQILTALDGFEAIKKKLKGGIESYSATALEAEERILALRQEVFKEFKMRGSSFSSLSS